MSRLDSVIRRLEAQRACLDLAARRITGKPGIVLELGLGNGRTYDHLRDRLPDRDIHVFERDVRAHPECIPPDSHLFLGDLGDTLPEAAAKLGNSAVLVHSDIGTGDPARNKRFAQWLGSALMPLLVPGAILISDQELTSLEGSVEQPLPEGVSPGRYFMYQFNSAE